MIVLLLIIIILILWSKTGALNDKLDGCTGCLPWIIGIGVLYAILGWVREMYEYIKLGDITEVFQIFFLGIVIAIVSLALLYNLNKKL
jgi:ABC-type transport system involved in cytochrome c biogenesis permease subunit